MQVAQLLRRLRARLAEDGLWSTGRAAIRALLPPSGGRPDDDFDTRYGTDTTGVVPLWRTGVRSPHAADGVKYACSREGHIQALLDPLPRDITLIDLGCGKGRTLCVAAMMGFTRVIGVEFVPEFAETARRNLAHLHLSATVITADATAYAFPRGPLAIYLYDPFGRTVMQPIAASLSTRLEHLFVIYVNPRLADCFEGWMARQPLTPAQTMLFSPTSVAVFRSKQ